MIEKMEIDGEMYDRLTEALNTLIGMASMHLPSAHQKYLDLGSEFDDMWIGREDK